MSDYADIRHGAAQWAAPFDLRKAGLIGQNLVGASGTYYGEFSRQHIHLDSAAPTLLIGGSGTGKLATVLGVNACLSAGKRNVWVDPKGEECAIGLENLVRWGKGGFVINPLAMHNLPRHTLSPLSFIKRGLLSTTADIQMIAEDLIAVQGDTPFFGQRARAWLGAFMKYDCMTYGTANLLRVREALHVMQRKKSDAWKDLARRMAATAEEIRAVVYEILTMQGDDGRAYGIITADLNTALMFLDDPAIRTCMSDDPDLDLESFVTGARDNDLFFIVPPELMGVWAPFIRLVISSLMIIKRRNPQAKQIDFYIDEAGQLKTAEFLPLAMTFGRGAGIKTFAVFQDIGQIEKSFGRAGLTTFIGSAQVRQLIGTRDPMTARILSEMLGNATIEYVDEVRKERAEQSARRAVFSAMMNGGDPFSAMLEAKQMRAQTEVAERMARPLASVDEIIGMGEGEQLLFISGVNCPPIRAQRRPYWTIREMAGHFMPNPYHPPGDQVQVMGRFGMQTRQVISEAAPDRIAALPQYRQSGRWRYIDGFRPSI